MQNIQQQFEKLSSKTESVLQTIEKGISWLHQNGDNSTKESKIKQLKESKRQFNRISRATTKNPSVAIFGQSQVGKSFLVRSLAKSPITSKLEVINSSTEERIDFLQKINPPGGRESTGIITRFSTSKPPITHNDYSFKIELLSQLDIAAIIINGYLEDIQEYVEEIDQEEIIETITRIKSELQTIPNSDIIEDDVLDFNDYLIQNYKDDYRIKLCKNINYFKDLIAILPNIASHKRWELLHFLWGKNEFLTSIFNRLSKTLADLDFSKTAYVNSKAIINGKKEPAYGDTSNILDVERVKEMFYTEPLTPLQVFTEKESVKTIPISEFSSLIKELHLQIPNDFSGDTDKKFLEDTDLLDFPGSKSREKIPETVFNSNKDKAKLSVFVRGKVSYLFYLYNRDIGISTLLYCMDHNPPLVSESPILLNKWIKRYIGGNTENRKIHQEKVLRLLQSHGIEHDVNQVSPLLIAMTKFNTELNGKGDAEEADDLDAHNAKWNARFQENFSNYMSKPVDDKWTENWTAQNDSFKFIFPIRDPGFSQAIFDGYDEDRTETKIKAGKETLLKYMGISFTQKSEKTKKFIFEREKFWNEITSPNQTGIHYLCEYLKPSSHPINMLTQLETMYTNTIDDSLKVLENEFSSGDLNTDLKQAKVKGAMAFTSILGLSGKTKNLLSSYLNQVITSEDEIWRAIYDFKFNFQEDEEQGLDHSKIKTFLTDLGVNQNSTEEELKEELIDFYDVEEDTLNEIILAQIGLSLDDLVKSREETKKPSEQFTDLILSNWAEKLSSFDFQNDSEQLKQNNEIFNGIFSEILKSNHTDVIKEEINTIIEEQLKEGISKENFNLISSSISSILNRFTFSASWLYSNEEDKPKQKQTDTKIFSEKSVLVNRDIITKELLQKNTKQYVQEFSLGVKEIYVKNINDKHGVDSSFDSKINEQIGNIISKIESFKDNA